MRTASLILRIRSCLPDVFNPLLHVPLGLGEVLVDEGGSYQLEYLRVISGQVQFLLHLNMNTVSDDSWVLS